MTTQYNLITGLSEYFKSDTQNIKNAYTAINSLRSELSKNVDIVNLTNVKKTYNTTLDKLKKTISSNVSAETLYNILEYKLKGNVNLNNKDLAILGLKFNDFGSFLSNYIKANKTFTLIIKLLPLLDAFYYYTDKNGNEIPYVFFALSLKLSNQTIQIADIEFILEFILLLYILDTDKDYYDAIEFEYEPNTTKVKKATINNKIKNPINILIYMYNSKIILTKQSVLIKLFTKNIPLLGSIKDRADVNIKAYLDYAFQDNDGSFIDELYNKPENAYYTSFGHYLGYLLKFYIDNDKYKIPQLEHLYLVVKLSNDLITYNENFNKYQNLGTQHGGGLMKYFKINKLFSNIYNVSHYAASKLNIMFRKSPTTLSNKLINKHLAKQPNLSYLLNDNNINKNSLKYYIESPEYSVFPLLLLSTTYDILNPIGKPSAINKVNTSSTTNKQNSILNDLLTKDVLEYINQYIKQYSKQNKYKNIVMIYGGLLKYLPIIIGLKFNIDDTNMTKKINNYIDYFLYVTSKITKLEADIVNKLLYCMVITINLYNYGYIYYYKVNSNSDIKSTQHATKKPFKYKKYKLTEDQNTLLYELLKKIAISIILDTDTFSSNILEIILLYKLHNLNKINKYSLFDNKLDLTTNELELLDNIFNTIIADDVYDMRYLVSVGTLNFYNKTKLIKQTAGNDNSSNTEFLSALNTDSRTPTPSANNSKSSHTVIPSANNPSRAASNNALPNQENQGNQTYLAYWFNSAIQAANYIGEMTRQSKENLVKKTLNTRNVISEAVNQASAAVGELASQYTTTVYDTTKESASAILNISTIRHLTNASNEFVSNLTDLMRENLNKPQKFDRNNNTMINLTVKLDKINKQKYKAFIASKQTKEYKEFTLLLQLKKFCNKLLEWQFVVSHVILEDKLKYSISNNIFMSKYSEILLKNAETFNNKDKLEHLLNELIKAKSTSKIIFINL